MSQTLTLAGRLAAYFKSKPEQWIDGMEISHIAGSYAWRSRISDLRRAPYGMDIENRQRRVQRIIVIDGEECKAGSYTISEYRYVPAQSKTEAA